MGLVAIGTGQSSPGTSQARPRPLLDRRQQPRSDDAQTQTLFLATLSQAISSFQTFWWIIQYLDYHSRESKKTQVKRIWSVRPKQFSLWILILVTTGNESFLKGPTVNTSFLNCRPQIKLRGTQKTFCTGEEGNTKWSDWYTSSLEKPWLLLKPHISCMLLEWSFQKDPDMSHGAHWCPSQHQECLQESSGALVQKRAWAKTHRGFPGPGRDQGPQVKVFTLT